MRMFRPHSLQLQLALRLCLLFLAATALAVGALLYQTYQTAHSFGAAGDADAFIHAMLREFVLDVAWIIPLFVVATLVVGVLALRSGLRPLRRAAAEAARITPDAISVRLPEQDLPSEVAPLVNTVNQALDRLERGFVLQRRFTADAAHQLRTPLTIITSGLETLEDNRNLAKLRQDVARMNRLVDQLLRVARLDAVVLDVSSEVELGAVARDVVESMAPLAIARACSLALTGADRPVRIKGNRHAVEEALRNLVENAIVHTVPQTEVQVEVANDGCLSVSDHGPGVPPEDRAHLFERFWRGRAAPSAGAGLGLAIVKETMQAHGGAIQVANNPGGGARFTLRFP